MTDRSFTAEADRLDIVSTYVFDASPSRVFEAYTDPKLIPDWWGPEGAPLTVDKMDVKAGGSWRFVMDVGQELVFTGVYHEVTPERLVFTWQFGGAPTVLMQTVTFEETSDGKTKVTDLGVFQTVKDRDGMLEMGMSDGSIPSFDRLAKLL